jgi:acyl transferase domain-containing protein
MLAVRLARADAAALLAEHGSQAVIAAVNGPASVVLSGPDADIAALEAVLAARQHSATRLSVSHAFHSPAMEPAARAMRAAAGLVPHGAPALPFISTVTGAPLDASVAWAEYWADQIVAPVEFDRAAARLAQEQPDVVIELGPRPVLVRQARAHFTAGTRLACALDPEQPLAALLATIGTCFEAGANPCFERLFMPGWQRQRLPSYPFEPQVHALYPPVRSGTAAVERGEHAFMRAARVDYQGDGASIVLPLSRTRYGYLGDHTVFGVDVLPATGFIELAQAAAWRVTGQRAWRLDKLEFRRPLVVREDDHELRIDLVRAPGGWRFTITDAGDPPGSESSAYSCGLLSQQPHSEEAAA